MKNVTLLVPSLILSSVLLSACVPLAPFLFGGAAVGSVLVASDRRTSGAQLEDEGIELRTANRFRTTFIERVHINVTSYNRQVLLTGEVPTAADKATAEQLAKQVENVKSVVNELEVLGNSTLTARSSDALVTSRVKAALVDDKDLYANAFKIVTERGTVYMMGRVSQREANKATEVVRSQQGVQKVVRLLEIISEEELKRIQPAPAAAPVPTGPTPVMSGSGSSWNTQPVAK
jgi:osmotically-inducible protein OsmY